MNWTRTQQQARAHSSKGVVWLCSGRNAAAAELAFGWPAGTVLAAYRANAESANRLALEQSPLVSFLRQVVRSHAGQQWYGTAEDLLVAINNAAAGKLKTDKGWPATPAALGNAIQRLAPALRTVAGWDVEQPTGGRRGRYWRLALPPTEIHSGQSDWGEDAAEE